MNGDDSEVSSKDDHLPLTEVDSKDDIEDIPGHWNVIQVHIDDTLIYIKDVGQTPFCVIKSLRHNNIIICLKLGYSVKY